MSIYAHLNVRSYYDNVTGIYALMGLSYLLNQFECELSRLTSHAKRFNPMTGLSFTQVTVEMTS